MPQRPKSEGLCQLSVSERLDSKVAVEVESRSLTNIVMLRFKWGLPPLTSTRWLKKSGRAARPVISSAIYVIFSGVAWRVFRQISAERDRRSSYFRQGSERTSETQPRRSTLTPWKQIAPCVFTILPTSNFWFCLECFKCS